MIRKAAVTVMFCLFASLAASAQTVRDRSGPAIQKDNTRPPASSSQPAAAARSGMAQERTTPPSLGLQVNVGGNWVNSLDIVAPSVLLLRWYVKKTVQLRGEAERIGGPPPAAPRAGAISGAERVEAVSGPGTIKWRLVGKPWNPALGTPMPPALGEGAVDTSKDEFHFGLAKYLPKTPPPKPQVNEYWVHIWPESAASDQIGESKGTIYIRYAVEPPGQMKTREAEVETPYYQCQGNAVVGKDGSRSSCHIYQCRDGQCLTSCKNINDCYDPDGKTSYCDSKNHCVPRSKY